MDEKLTEGDAKPKITRSRARHIRRKRLISARRAADDNLIIVENIKVEENLKNSESNQITDTLSKSKARRLRKRNKTQNEKNQENDLSENTDSTKAPLESENKLSEKKSDIEDPIIESKINPSEHELIQNEKNRKISKNFAKNDSTSTQLIVHEEKNVRAEKISCDHIEASPEEKKDEKEVEKKEDVNGSTMNPEKAKVCVKNEQIKMNTQEKTREEIKAEREAKKAAKAAAKNKAKGSTSELIENVASSKPVVQVGRIKVCEPKGDVVDGEITGRIRGMPVSGLKSEITAGELIELIANKKKTEEIEAKRKSELKAERRAKQEAQRAAKQALIQEKQKIILVKSTPEATELTAPKKAEESVKKAVKQTAIGENTHQVNLFKHLYHSREQALMKNVPTINSNIHPAIVRLGVQYASKVIVGSNARCVALLAAVKQLIQDFERPSQADFTRGLEACLQESSTYLHHCRPLAVSMQNALRHLKWQMTQLSPNTADDEAKTILENAIDTYIQEQIQLADKAISITIQTKISNGDVILTYGYSSLIFKILCDAHDAGRQFRVVVVDGRPWLEGREQLRRLAKHGLECSYVLINALSFIMPEVSKVFLGAHAILANGAVMSRVGTAQVALMAKSFNVPVLVACETHKTCERVQTDSIVYNEIANADELAQSHIGGTKKATLANWRGKKSLNLLNITYDVTPADLVTAVVTEIAILPCTSVPVILRIKPSEI